MKKTTYIYLAILVALAASTIFILSRNRSGTIPQALRDFAVPDTQNVNKIFLADRMGTTVLLERKTPGEWIVNKKYPAFKDRIDILLMTIAQVQVKNPIPHAARENYLKQMAEGSTKVEIYKNGQQEPVKVYTVGGTTPDQLGTLMLLKGSSEPFVTYIPGFEGYLTTRYFTNEREWRTRNLYEIPPASIKEISYTFPGHPDESFRFRAEGNKFTVNSFAQQEKTADMQPNRAKSFLVGFSHVEFEEFYAGTPARTDSILNTQPILVMDVKAEGLNVPQVKLFPFMAEGNLSMSGRSPVDPSRFYATLSTSPKEIIVVQKRTLERILRSYSDLVK